MAVSYPALQFTLQYRHTMFPGTKISHQVAATSIGRFVVWNEICGRWIVLTLILLTGLLRPFRVGREVIANSPSRKGSIEDR
jgi:hypothetical protein